MPGLPLRWSLARQDRRSADLARRHGALGLLMAAEHLDDIVPPIRLADTMAPTARMALDVLWRTLYSAGRPTVHWTPATAHLRQGDHVRRWARGTDGRDHHALLRRARGVAADEFLRARTGPTLSSRTPAVPSA